MRVAVWSESALTDALLSLFYVPCMFFSDFSSFSCFGFQETVETDVIHFATDEENLRLLIRNSHEAGMMVFFKPVIEISGRLWRGLIPGSDGWFASYRGFIHRMAEIATEENVELFAVGSEYRDASQKAIQWRSVIQTVKTAYSGPLTYVANHDSYESIEFFDDLDLVSLSAYQSLLPDDGDTTSPSEETVRQLWEDEVGKIGTWLTANFPADKKLMVAEIGAQSRGEGLAFRRPWDWEAEGELNLDDQAIYYKGFLSAFLSKSWCIGVNIWNWEANPDAGMPGTEEETWYTPQNKPAERIVTSYFQENKTS